MENFRAFRKVELPLSRITVLVGPNNSGKSAIISAINLFPQTLDSADPDVPLLLSGNRVDLGTYTDVIHGNNPALPMMFSFDFQARRGKKIVKCRLSLDYEYMRKRREIFLKRVALKDLDDKVSYELLRKYERKTAEITIKARKRKRTYRRVVDFDNFLPMRWLFYEFDPKDKQMISDVRMFRDLVGMIFGDFIDIEYIGPFRDDPKRAYLFSGEKPDSVGRKGENAINILMTDSYKPRSERKNVSKKVSRWVRRSGMAKGVEIAPISTRHFEVRLTGVRTKSHENLADVGFGCGQILPVLVGGYNLDKGQLFIVEQPELHLHPKAQAEIGSFLHELYKSDNQVIVETHSEHLILRLQALVAGGKIRPNDLKVYYVSGNRKTPVKELRVNEKGIFVDDWPGGFFPERFEEAKRIAKAQIKEG
jgi:hypothetical protein